MSCLLALCILALPAGGYAVTTPGRLDSLLRYRTPECGRPLPAGEAPPRSGRFRSFGPVPAVDSVIRDDFVCNDDATGGCRQSGPAVGVAADGSFTIAWYGFTDGETDIWFQSFDAWGTPLGPNRSANGDSAMRWQGDPACAVAPGGSFLLTWEDRWTVGNSDIFGQRYAPDGSEVGRNFRLSDSAASGDQIISSAAIAPSGRSLVAWDDRRFGLTGDIFAQFYDSSGARLDTNFRVNDDGVGMANQYQPTVAGDDSGRFVVVWMDGRGNNAYDWNIFAQRFSAGRARLGANIQVTTDDSIQWGPELGVAPSGRFAACWEDRRRAQWDVYARVFDAAGQPTGADFRVSTDAGEADQFGCCAAGNRYDEFLVAWTDRRSGNDEIWARRFDRAGVPLDVEFLVSAAGASAGRGEPDAAARPDGGWVVTWADGTLGDVDIVARRLGRDGTPADAPFRVNTDTASALQRVSSIDMYSDGRILVTWEDERNGGTDIYSTLLARDGMPTASNRRLNDDEPGGTSQYYATASAGRSRSLVTWTDGRDGFNIVGQFLDSLGTPAGANFVVNAETAGGIQWYSYSAMDDSNRSVVVWMDTRADAYRVFCRRYDATGLPVGGDFPASTNEGTQYYGSVAMSRAGRVLVTWMDYRQGSRPDIYCQLFDTSGARIGGEFYANDDIVDDNYHGYPAAAVAEDGSFAVTWEDTRNDAYDVYLQWFDSTGAPVGTNVRVNDGPVGSDAYSPSCDFDRLGRLAVLINDERAQPGNPQVLCQRYRADRSRISGNQQLNNPNTFPRNHHWTYGRSIVADDEAIASAWTENRRHQGWDIFGKLTDWDLIGIGSLPGPARPCVLRVRPTISATGRFVVESPELDLILRDAAGRSLSRVVLRGHTDRLDLARLASGVYFLECGTGGARRMAKLVVQ